MALTWHMFAIICPLCFLAGFVDSVAGGGGLISLPAYYLAGLSPVVAAGTNKLSACIGTVAASGRFLAGHRVDVRVALLAALGAFPGSWLGAVLLQSIPEQTVIAAIPLVAVVVLRRKKDMMGKVLAPGRWRLPAAFGIGLLVGFYDGLVGPGTGTFLILLFTMILGLEAVLASGTAKLVNLTSNLAALIPLVLAGKVIFGLGIPAAVCAVAGNLLGASMTLKKGVGFIRWMMLVVLALLLAKMVADVVI